MIKLNKLKIFKIHTKDRRFVLNLRKKQLTTNEENSKEGLK